MEFKLTVWKTVLRERSHNQGVVEVDAGALAVMLDSFRRVFPQEIEPDAVLVRIHFFVQLSVFECDVGDTDMVKLRHQLLEEMNPHEDSIRFYFLGEDPSKRVEHHGQRPSIDFNDALIV